MRFHYLYFKIDRIEHIWALSSQVVDIEYSVFQYVGDAKERLAYELDRVSNTSDQGDCPQKVLSGNRGRPHYDVQNINVHELEEFVTGVNVR